jgi:anti-sigma B factor antagonist
MASTDRARDEGTLSLASTFLASFPPSARPSQERRLASLSRVREDGILTIRAGRDGRNLIVRASGELDMASAETFEEEVRRAIEGGASTMVLELEGVTFIDSTGLRALLVAAELSHSKGLRLLVHPSKEIRRLVEVSGVEDAVPLVA